MPLQRRTIIYCGECGMPPEYCEYGPDFETHCNSWLLKNYPSLYKKICIKADGDTKMAATIASSTSAAVRPSEPWTIQERLVNFYEKYQPDKVDSVPNILEKYAGKEDKLFVALVKKYGPEPDDPYYADSDEEDVEGHLDKMSLDDENNSSSKKKRRGAAAKKLDKIETRIVIQKVSRNKRKAVTIIMGMDTIPDLKLKEASKAFSKKFAGSSSVKDTPQGKKEIIIQGDHMEEVAAMIVKKFKVAADSVFLDINGEFVPIK